MFKVVKSQMVDPFLIDDLLPCFDHGSRESAAKNIADGGVSFTFLSGNKIIGVIGGHVIRDTTMMYGWSILGEGIKNHRLSFAKAMRRFMDETMITCGLTRFFVTVDTDNHVAIRQNEWMGLVREGVLRKAGHRGQDVVILAKVVG